MSAEGREGPTPPIPDEERATFGYNLDDVIGNGQVTLVEEFTLRIRLGEFTMLEVEQGKAIDPSDELCWLSLAVGWFLGKGHSPDVAKAAALAVRYAIDNPNKEPEEE